MSNFNDIIQQLKEQEERNKAEINAYKENEAKLKELQKEIKDFEAEFEELKKENLELRKELAEKEIKVNFMQQRKNEWTEMVNKNRSKIKEQEDCLEEIQQKIWKDRISFCDMVDDFAKKHDLMAMYRGEMFPEGKMFPDEKTDTAAPSVQMESESELEASSSNSILAKNTNLVASRPHFENISTRRVNKSETTTSSNKQTVGQVKRTRDNFANFAELEKEMSSVAEEAEALHKFKQFTVDKSRNQDYGLKHESPYFKWEATRVPNTVLSGHIKNINESHDISQSSCHYTGESFYQPGPSNAYRFDSQKFTSTSFSTNTGNNNNKNNMSTYSVPVAARRNKSSTNEMKEFHQYEKKFTPKVPSSTLRSSTAPDMQQCNPQMFKFSLSKRSGVNQ